MEGKGERGKEGKGEGREGGEGREEEGCVIVFGDGRP